jgi:hypothetical protein
MKILFALLLMATPALADSNVLTCQVQGNSADIPQGSYVELDPSGPFLVLYRDYSRKNGPIYYVKSDLVSSSILSSWKVERPNPNCTLTMSDDNSINFNFSCDKVNQFLSLNGSLKYDETTASGHYSQSAVTNDTAMKFEFDFTGCQ